MRLCLCTLFLVLLLALPTLALDKEHLSKDGGYECYEPESMFIPNTYSGIATVSFAALDCWRQGGILICRYDGDANWLCVCVYKNLK